MIKWYEEVRRVVIANNWKDAHIHTIVAAYLRGIVVDYYKKVKGVIAQWAGKNAIANLKNLLIIWFALNSIKNVWYSDYLNCW